MNTRFHSILVLFLITGTPLWSDELATQQKPRPTLDCKGTYVVLGNHTTASPSDSPLEVSKEDIRLSQHDPGYRSLTSDAWVTPEIGSGMYGVVHRLAQEPEKVIKIPRKHHRSIDQVNAAVEREFAGMKRIHQILPNHSVEPLEIVWAEPKLKAITMKHLSGYVDLAVTGNAEPNTRFSKQTIEDLEHIRDALLTAKVAITDFHGNLVCDDNGRIALVDTGASAKFSENDRELAQMKKQFDRYIDQVKDLLPR